MAVFAALAVALFAVTASAQTGPKITSANDSDFIIGDGGSITVTVTDADSAAYTFQPIFGFVLTGAANNGPATYTHQAGAPMGDFTIRATSPGLATLEKALMVGDPGTNLATVHVNLDTTNAAGAARAEPTAEGAKAETDTAMAGGRIFINVEVKNSLGNASNVGDDPADLDVIVFAVGGTVAQGDANTSTTSASGNSADSNKIDFVVSKEDAGMVEVFATATIGSSSVRSTESLILSFSGGPDVISSGDASGGLLAPATEGAANMGVISFEVTSVDAAGTANSASDTADDLVLDAGDIAAGFKITNEEGDDVTAKFAVDRSAKKDNDVVESATPGDTAIDESKISDNAIAVVITPGNAPGVPGGSYTATVTLDEGSKNSVEVDFNVVGPLDSLTAAADTEVVVEDGQFTVTATLQDANGLPVADGKADVAANPNASPAVAAEDNSGDDVIFSVIGGDLNVWGQDSTEKGQVVTKEVKGGTAAATFYVTGASGKSIVLVRSGDKTARVTVAIEGEPEEAMPEEEASVACLSNLAGFATWACGVESSASEIFGLVSGRGATALHLWNGSAWVRYSVVDGTMVPGSSDFMVAENDILYISN